MLKFWISWVFWILWIFDHCGTRNARFSELTVGQNQGNDLPYSCLHVKLPTRFRRIFLIRPNSASSSAKIILNGNPVKKKPPKKECCFKRWFYEHAESIGKAWKYLLEVTNVILAPWNISSLFWKVNSIKWCHTDCS